METIAAGAPAPGFQLPSIGGGTRGLADLLADGPVALVFFKASCPVCQFTLPFLERMAAGPALRFVAISQDGEETTRGFRERFGVTFLTLIDGPAPRYPASDAYGIAMVPSIFVVEGDGRISKSVAGFSKKDMEALGARAGIPPFGREDRVPEWKAG